MEIADTLGFLLGRWQVSRSYTDHRGGTAGTFRGEAVLTAAEPGDPPGSARYRENGELRLGEYRGPASRSLEYERQADDTVMLYRPGRQPYIEVNLTSGTWQASHPCGADQYEVSFVVRSQDLIEESWQVRGPDKDYDAVTTLRRLG